MSIDLTPRARATLDDLRASVKRTAPGLPASNKAAQPKRGRPSLRQQTMTRRQT